MSVTYDHSFRIIALPVRSAVLKPVNGGLVVRWVTTGESPLLYVFALYFASMTLARDAVMSQTWDHQSQQDMSWLCMSLLLLR